MLSHEVEYLNEQNTLPAHASVDKSSEHPMEQEANEKKGEHADGDQVEDEFGDEDEEDVDFNPFLKETPSREASSSLSSEIEGLDADVADSGENAGAALATDSAAKLPHPVQDYPVVDTDPGEEIVTQTTTSPAGVWKKGSESGSQHENNDGSGSQLNADNDLVAEEFNNIVNSQNPLMNMDDEDAICMRTRARYSLVSFTLDELETFLQETDDDDDLQNVDDEEEYRKFLAAVLQGGDGDPQSVQENENVDDEDEENDADFELEIEEALESDIDEDAKDEIQEELYEAAGRRPKTRQNRRKNASVDGNKKLLGQSKRPLRPLLPNPPITQRLPFSSPVGKSFIMNHAAEFLPSTVEGSINGFTPHQIGQLHCLIHEHVQFLVQVFSICVLEPSRRHITAKVQELILEMLHVRDHVLAWRRLPYPSFCFFPPHIHPSVPNEVPRLLSAPCINDSSSPIEVLRNCPSGNNMVPPDIISAPKGRRESLCNGQNLEASPWMPDINGPVLSVLDVAPLKFVGNFVDDVSAVVQEYHRRQVELSCDTRAEKEPLFPLNNASASTELCDQVLRGIACSSVPHSLSNSDQIPKKTMASALVERAKKQSVAPVPKEIAKLAQRFYPLFNPALYPHKPPPAPLANRVLFTDAEDELLALGLMEYNTDWKAIQQRFLPCKSKHQIFVRQKNRSSSKAPENPIKAVRRMKSSPLTTEEIARIEEGLKIFKLDWMSIWKFIVPYRDPSLLPRQWRIATGTQKSYKSDEKKKSKRQLYERNRRNKKSAALANWESSPEKEDNSADKACEAKNNVDNQMDREDEAYVHEAFLADWRPGTTVSSRFPKSGLQEQFPPIQPTLQEVSQVSEELDRSRSGDAQTPVSNELLAAVRSSSSQLCWRPYRARRVNNARVVKLAPDLPPVNLPPSVRVMSQSAFKSHQGGAPLLTRATNSSASGPGAESGVIEVVKQNANSGVSYPVKAGQLTRSLVNPNTGNRQPQDSLIIRNKHIEEEKDESDLQMHPLLFQAPENGRFPYYPLHSSASASSSFNFFAGSPPQLNLSLFHNPRPASSAVNFLEKSLKPKESTSAFQVDFHPLLQRSDNLDSSLVTARSAAQLSANLETSEGRCPQIQNPLGANYNSSTAASDRPVSPNEKINELDLDIHLSFTSRQQMAQGRRDVNECSTRVSVASATDSSNQGSQQPIDSAKKSSQYISVGYASERNGSKSDSGVHMVVIPSDDGIRNNADNIEDESLPEIVMEQEELSDSDDEIGDKVEFECEEMADSEAEEESDSEQRIDIQNEEVENADFENQQSRPIKCDDSKGNAFRSIEGHATNRNADNSSSSLCLNLNSCPPGSPLLKPNDESLKSISATLDETVHSCAGKVIENISSNDDITVEKQVVDLAAQPNVSYCSTSKKPRKRACGTVSRLSRGTSKRRTITFKTDTNTAKSKHISKGELS
ncbi:hypothetical protein ACH5RR_014832 [Cinchona calisaya]|uniref:Homeodomain-like superfamily protein n=1 Tax=Cinchona calisaya TaxID=153742 RepID=A0ABD2ZRU1_9GENT